MADSLPREGSFAEELANQGTVMARQSPASMAPQPSRRQAKSLAFSGGCSSSRKMSRCSPDGGDGREGSHPCSAAGPEVPEQGFCHSHTSEMQPKAYPGDDSGSAPPLCSDLLSALKQLTETLWGNQEQGTRCTLHQVVPLTFFQKCKYSGALEEDSACVWRQVGSSSSLLTS